MEKKQDLLLALLPLGIPVAVAWVWNRERLSRRYGRPLNAAETVDARAAGVRHPERVRIWLVEKVELFSSPLLNRVTAPLQKILNTTLGITLRYGILIRNEWDGDRRLLVHELAHVAQYERLGGIASFLTRYFRDCVQNGYSASAMEREATLIATRICCGSRKELD